MHYPFSRWFWFCHSGLRQFAVLAGGRAKALPGYGVALPGPGRGGINGVGGWGGKIEAGVTLCSAENVEQNQISLDMRFRHLIHGPFFELGTENRGRHGGTVDRGAGGAGFAVGFV